MSLLEVRQFDKAFYEERLRDFLPKTFIDCHAHIWLDEQNHFCEDTTGILNAWPYKVAKDNSVEDLEETNRLLFPQNKVISVLYGEPMVTMDIKKNNDYVAACAEKYGYSALYLTHPSQSCESIEREFAKHPCFKGLKVYLQFAPSYIPVNEIRIFDFLPPEHLALANRHGWVVQVHIARPKRLADPVNYVQLRQIEEQYPDLQLIVAHLGRAYAEEDLGEALEYLKSMKKTVWDFTANTNQRVMERVLEQFGPERFLYGTDFPVFRMRARRVAENGVYINEVPQGSLGDISGAPHMREIAGAEAEKITFFIYEEIDACRRACENLGLGRQDVEKIFFGNAAGIFGITDRR